MKSITNYIEANYNKKDIAHIYSIILRANFELIKLPDNNVYPCIFLTKPGYEIGKLIDGKIMVEEKYENNHDKCLVSELCNNGIKLTKKLNH